MKKTYILSLIIAFVALTGIFLFMRSAAPDFRFPVLMGGNIIMLALSLISYFLVSKQVNNRTQAFITGVHSATFLKLFICLINIVAYVMINKPNVHKPTIFVLLGIYVVYSAIETIMLSKIVRAK